MGDLGTLDFLVIAGYFIVTITVGLMFAKRASKGVDEFFLAGRKLTWWMAGGSMVATMFASDTPLFHTGNVREGGLSAGWMFLFPMFGALLAGAVFAPLMRRTRVVTDAEFLELRYSGRAPGFFRAFLAIYYGLLVASLTMGWVTKGMQQVISTTMGLDDPTHQLWAVIILLGITVLYSMASGMWGVVMTDMFQYIVASAGSLLLAYIAIRHVGGLEGLRSGLAAIPNYSGSDLHFLPTGKEVAMSSGALMMSLPLIIGWVLVQGGAQATSAQHQGQRILACRSERDASLTFIFFSFCYYLVNGLPWFLVGLASMLVLGSTNATAGIAAPDQTFPAMIRALMPAGLKGLMVASLFAAFMSTVSVLLNWGGSFLVNDIYRRFINRDGQQSHYVWVSRFSSIFIAIFGGVICLSFPNLTAMMLEIPPLLMGATFVFLLRWLWWRVNIWTEISAYIASPIIGFYVQYVMGGYPDTVHPGRLITWFPWVKNLPGYGIWPSDPLHQWETYGQRLLAPAVITLLIAIIVTLLTKPTSMEKLKDFFVRVRPPGPGWNRIRREFAHAPHADSMATQLLIWVSSCVMMMGLIMGVICCVQGHNGRAIGFVIAGIVGLFVMIKALDRIDHDVAEPDSEPKA